MNELCAYYIGKKGYDNQKTVTKECEEFESGIQRAMEKAQRLLVSEGSGYTTVAESHRAEANTTEQLNRAIKFSDILVLYYQIFWGSSLDK